MKDPERTIAATLEAVGRRVRLDRTMRIFAIVVPWLALTFTWWTLAGRWFALAFVAVAIAAFALIRIGTNFTFRHLLAVFGRKGVAKSEIRPDRNFSAAYVVERRTPSLRNVLITAVEIIDGRLRTSQAFRDRVIAEAAERTAGIQPGAIVPLAPAVRLLALSTVAAALLLLAVWPGLNPRRLERAAGRIRTAVVEPVVSVVVRVTPPAYLPLPVRDLRDPERIEVIEGATVDASSVHGLLRWVDHRGVRSRVSAALRLKPPADGFIAVEQGGATRRVIPVLVRRDDAPRVAIAKPRGDLQLQTAQTIAIEAAANDDHGLVSAELRYTRVSGSGEQFEFTTGVLPVRITRASDTAWSLRAGLPLSKMGAAAGDTIVFRIAARDARGVSGEGQSDALMIEIAAAGAIFSASAAIDPSEDRFALSQQMILLKLRRLHAIRRSLTTPVLQERSQMLAAEQRSVRAVFVFMLGGEVEDEEVEAAHSHEIQEGRLEDTSRRDLVLAMNLMSRVEQHLVASQTSAALPPAAAAVDAVQRAFGRRRYFLRTAPVRMRIDPARRLAGDTRDVRGLAVETRSTPADTSPLRVIDDLITLASAKADVFQQPGDVAARLLALDPAEADLQRLAGELQRVDARSRSDVRDAATEVLAALAARERRRRPGQLGPISPGAALRSAWADQWRTGGAR